MLPSRETKPTTIRNPVRPLETFTPWRCTSCGSSGMASCSLFCTCTCAMSGSVPVSKVRLIPELPVDSLVADM